MKVIIVEDEFLAQQELSWLIKEHSQMEIVGTFDDGLDVLKFLQHNRVDAIFWISIFRRWTVCCWRKTSASSPINRLLCSSPRGKNMR
ncbi:protein mrkE [Shigella boydii 5216-82]|nr:protein mrkE [Shigella boydii 5216-82]